MKKKLLPAAVRKLENENQNVLIRRKKKTQRHIGDQGGRDLIGGIDEFDTLIVNPLYRDTIEKYRRAGNLNICIFDDYMDFGNGFNAVRCIFESLGANKILLVSMGCFRSYFVKREYEIIGSVYEPNYTYREMQPVDYINLQINSSVNDEIDQLWHIFNL